MDVQRVDFTDDNAQQKFCNSLKETGFAVLYNHPIDKQLITDVYQEWQAFFSSEDKENYRFNHDTQDGFFPQSVSEKAKGFDVLDIKEYYHYYPWGMFPTELSDKTKQLYKALNEMAHTLLDWVEQGLPQEIAAKLSVPLSQMLKDTPNTLLRILHYPPLTGDEDEGAVRAAAHGDINLLTLLVGATDAGLQVQDIDGEWHDVPTDRDSIAVNIGDMLELCTDNYYKSTLHRVVNPIGSNTSRLSMPLFLHARPDVKLQDDFTAGQFLEQRLKELGVY